MHNKLISVILLAFSFIGAYADGIQFREMTLPEAQSAAELEHKYVFVDCYTPTCGPCKFMARHIFPMDSCGTYMNPRFVSVMKDLAAEDNKYIAEKYDVRIYPTYLILRPNGELYVKMEGGATKYAGKFLKRVDDALELGSMHDRYTVGERDIEFLTAYTDALRRPNPAGARMIISDYTEGLSADEVMNADNLQLIKKLGDIDCDGFKHLMDIRDQLTAKIGKEKVAELFKTIHDTYTTRMNMMRRNPSPEAIAREETLRAEGFIQ